jgi:ubiquinone/menaquinone biosynthesis C-methylase UbiE
LRNLPGAEIHGSDIDPEAIAWCKAHLHQGKFFVSGPVPPLPFEDATFDVVIATSVFTHLAQDVQNAWLAELRRIIVPGGLLLPTVNGEFGIRRDLPAETAKEIIRSGFSDKAPDTALDGITPENYYRSTYQTKEYTLEEWSKYFEILEYIEKGLLDHQDLVVMRRPS